MYAFIFLRLFCFNNCPLEENQCFKLPEVIQQDINDAVTNKRMLLKNAIEPIEGIVHDYTVEILKV